MHQTATASPEDRSTEFRPVEGGTEVRSGTLLLIEAYAAVWLILFGFLVLMSRRQRKLDQRIAQLEQAVARNQLEKS